MHGAIVFFFPTELRLLAPLGSYATTSCRGRLEDSSSGNITTSTLESEAPETFPHWPVAAVTVSTVEHDQLEFPQPIALGLLRRGVALGRATAGIGATTPMGTTTAAARDSGSMLPAPSRSSSSTAFGSATSVSESPSGMGYRAAASIFACLGGSGKRCICGPQGPAGDQERRPECDCARGVR